MTSVIALIVFMINVVALEKTIDAWKNRFHQKVFQRSIST
jgi:hypothetical protein